MRLIDIEPYQKDGWILQKTEEGHDCTVIKRTPLHAIPTVDAVPVVRCGDCSLLGGEKCLWHNFCPPSYDYFCADGERKKRR